MHGALPLCFLYAILAFCLGTGVNLPNFIGHFQLSCFLNTYMNK